MTHNLRDTDDLGIAIGFTAVDSTNCGLKIFGVKL